MIATLPGTAHDHHERLMQQVDRLPELGDSIGTVPLEILRERVAAASAFFTGTLLPHIEATERALYPELERMLQNRHSMVPMRREHEEVRRLVEQLEGLRRSLDHDRLSTGEAIALRRILFRLYAILKVHLAEEALYVGIIDHGVAPEAAESLAAAMAHATTEA